MTSRSLLKWSVGLAFGLLPLAGGCQQESSSPPLTSSVAGATTSQIQSGEAPSPGEPPAGAIDASAANLAEAPVTLIATDKHAPPYIRPGSPVAEVVKLANSGVDESVLLAFVKDSQSTFNLEADQIIYLNDIGVPGEVVTAMLQHDQNFVAMNPPPAPTPQPPDTTPPPPDATAPPVEAPLTPPEGDDSAAFYDSLAPYGNWVNVDGYGPCWQPTAVIANPGWQPYFDGGHWAYTDCGWYWVSDYSWGWAPFHYGRWFRHHQLGWCWVPGNVWGPSWVSWRYSDDYCGWAPLPPGVGFSFGFGLSFHGHHLRDGDDFGLGWDQFRFVPWGAFRQHHLHGFAVGGRQSQEIFRHTVAVNRFVGGHNVAINQGISASRVAAATHQVIEPLRIRDTAEAAPRAGRAERIDSSARTLTAYRPSIGAAHNPANATGTGFAGNRNSPAWTATTYGAPHSGTAPPLILRGQQQLSPRSAPAPAPPGTSLVIIGRPQNGRSQIAATERSTASAQWQRAAPSQSDESRSTPWLSPRAYAPARSTTAGQYADPRQEQSERTVPQRQMAPSYGVQRTYSAPAPSYRSQPSAPSRPAYSEVPRSAQAPAYSGGARSVPSAPAAPSSHGSDSGHR